MRLAFADQLRGWREGSGLTQVALAEKLKVTQQTVSDWETGAIVPRLERLHQIADALGIDRDEVTRAVLAVDEIVMTRPAPALLEALAGVEKLTPERRAQLVGYLERLLEEQATEGTK